MNEVFDFVEDDSQSNMFDVEFCSIDDMLNSVVLYKGMTDFPTTNGLRKLIAVTTNDGTDTAFLTSSKKIIEQVEGMNVNKRIPFRAVMKCVSYGGAFIGFKLFPPNSEVTDEDRRLSQQYKKTKFKH